MPAVRPFFQDPFKPVLFSSPALVVSPEQTRYIDRAIRVACSDSRFAEKLSAAILYILTAGNSPLPVISSINPTTAAIGSPSFTLNVIGTGFKDGSKIIWNGSEEVTVHQSDTVLTTQVNMSTATVATPIGVEVMSPEGVISNTMTFTITPAVP